MKKKLLFALICLPLSASAASLTLQQYLDSVRQQNPAALAAEQSVEAFTGRLREGELMFSTELYANYTLMDNQAPQLIPAFMGTDTHTSEIKVGLRKQTDFGLGADLSVDGMRTAVAGLNNQLLMGSDPDSYTASGTLTLTQSFWRNGFGEQTRADEQALDAKNSSDLLQAKYNLKTILLNSENAYWSVVSFNEIIRLQEQNVERAKRLQSYMNRQAHDRLVDDTDAIQADAALESRALELQTSIDNRAAAIRDFNTLRGAAVDDIGELEPWPNDSMMSESKEDPNGQMSREDFQMMRAQAKAALAQAMSAKSKINPQFDVRLTGATNGRDGLAQFSIEQAGTTQYPMWSIALMFSMPLDFGLISDVKQGYAAAKEAADKMDAQAEFNESRTWDDLVKKKREAQGRYQRALRVEHIQADLVNRERKRLLNGRATTFESLSFEQNLALAQIQRVQSQLALLQLHNTLKTFEVKR